LKHSYIWLAVLALATSAASAGELVGVWIFEKETNTRANRKPADVPPANYQGEELTFTVHWRRVKTK